MFLPHCAPASWAGPLFRGFRPFLTALGLVLAIWTPASAAERQRLRPETAPAAADAPPLSEAFVTVHRPADPNGAAVIICPGGGYGGLVTGAEGHGIARWLDRHHVTGIVLEYRLPRGDHRLPLADAQRAIRWVRSHAADWGLDPHRVGILGFSAGGHLASTAATHFDDGNPASTDPVERPSCRPDFAILVYPVVSMTALGHAGSRANLLGPDPSPDLVASYSNERQVTERTPPIFLAHAVDDTAVSPENSRLLHRALRDHGVPTEYLELPNGGHGLNGYRGPSWDAWQAGSLAWLARQRFIPPTDVAEHAPSPEFPRHDTLARGPLQVRPLTPSSDFVFSLYGAPGDLATVRQLVDVMRSRGLGNGFDPGPGAHAGMRPVFDYLASQRWPVVLYSGGEMQIRGGRAVFGSEHQSTLAPMFAADVFAAYQLGEWGYYFHNLAPRESWWRDVYGKDFETYKHLMKPAGLAGYDKRPANRQECHDTLKEYFLSRRRDLLGRVISVTGHSHYEAYAAAWGTECVGLEVAENIAFTQSKIAFARGAARAWNKPWSVQVSPWFGPSCTTSGPLRTEAGIVRGLDAGHSLSLYERLWLHGWFAGAAMVTPENSIAIFFEKPEAPWTLTEHGRKAAEVYAVMRNHHRGIPYTPVAVVLDRLAGYNAYMDKPWGILEPTPADRELRDLFDHQLYPGSDHIHTRPDPANPEASYLRPTPYGEIFDVLLSDVPADVLPRYPVILLAGDLTFDLPFLTELEKSLRGGSRLLLHPRHRDTLGADFDRLRAQGNVEVLETTTLTQTGRPAAIAPTRLAALARELAPVEVSGSPIQYLFNRTATGWVVALVHDAGVAKQGNQPTVIDPDAKAGVRLRPRFLAAPAHEWRSGRRHLPAPTYDIDLGPGAIEFVEFTETTR